MSSKRRNILLIEPKYKNKYPPIGLMKIATYHKMLGDNVIFFKGDLKDLVLDQMTEECIHKLIKIDNEQEWRRKHSTIRNYIKTKRNLFLEDLNIENSKYKSLIVNCITYFATVYYKKDYDNFPKWDRIYITTLFTFYWKVTVEAIQYAKNLVTNQKKIWVGGVLASLLYGELEQETGIKPYKGLLDKPDILDPNNKKAKGIIIDNLPLDYSILDEIEYIYPTGSAYFTYMTKGCTRKCAFCSVPILEPTYKAKVDTIDKFSEINEIYGEQQHLLLMDNNVLASPRFPEIIEEIKEMGFYNGATYIEPNQLEISIRNLKKGMNNKAYVRRCYFLFHELLKKLRGNTQQTFYNTLDEYNLIKIETITKEGVINAYDRLKDIYERYRPQKPKQRFVDFNQGVDARYITEDLMKLMSEIPIRPLRVAFDYWEIKDKYENSVRLAAKYNIKELSNYILYNFKDTPEDLYKRLQFNVELGEELNIHIYSFPMKYIPLFGEEAKDRTFIGSHWNKKFIRAIQSVLNVTKGIVAPGRSFFTEAFGRNMNEFFEILYMPETYIVYRHLFRDLGYTEMWRTLYYSLSDKERELTHSIVISNDFKNYLQLTDNPKILELLRHYTIKREDVNDVKSKDLNYSKMKQYFDKLIKDDQFKTLTLTYDFE